jgi:adenylate cyclase
MQAQAIARSPASHRDSLAPKQTQADGAMFPNRTNLKRQTPGALLRRLIAAPRRGAEPVERDLTVMFTDIAGFTELAERLPPRHLARMLTRHIQALSRCVERERGTVAKILGDGLMAFWDGAPTTAPALRAALAIRAAVEADNRAQVKDGLVPIRLRIGLHAGALVMARLGAGLTPLGDTVNVAQRLEDAARQVADGREVAIVASETVVDRAGTSFAFEPLGNLTVRGRSGPVRAFRLT